MRKKTEIIRTSNRELYKKLNVLHFSPEVLLKNTSKKQVDTILNKINKNGSILETEQIGDYLILKKKKTFDFSVYLR